MSSATETATDLNKLARLKVPCPRRGAEAIEDGWYCDGGFMHNQWGAAVGRCTVCKGDGEVFWLRDADGEPALLEKCTVKACGECNDGGYHLRERETLLHWLFVGFRNIPYEQFLDIAERLIPFSSEPLSPLEIVRHVLWYADLERFAAAAWSAAPYSHSCAYGWICEAHLTEPFEHLDEQGDRCPGPGEPCRYPRCEMSMLAAPKEAE